MVVVGVAFTIVGFPPWHPGTHEFGSSRAKMAWVWKEKGGAKVGIVLEDDGWVNFA